MGAVFEGNGNGSAIIQDAAGVNTKAGDLNELVGRIAQEVFEIDEQIRALALNGIKGSAMTKAVHTYNTNREVIDQFVKRFAATACVLSESAIAHSNVNDEAETAAAGVQ